MTLKTGFSFLKLYYRLTSEAEHLQLCCDREEAVEHPYKSIRLKKASDEDWFFGNTVCYKWLFRQKLMGEETLLPSRLGFNQIKEWSVPQVAAVYEKILLDLKRERASLDGPPNYFSFAAVEGAGRFYVSQVSYSVTPSPWESLAIFVNLRRTGEDRLMGYFPFGFQQEVTALLTEIHFQLLEELHFVSNNEALLDGADWFLKTQVRTVVVRGKLDIAAGRVVNQKWIGQPLNAEELLSSRGFFEEYLEAQADSPVFIKDLRRDLASKDSNEARQILSAHETLSKLYALSIGQR